MIKVKVKVFDIEAETVDEAARLARQLTNTATHSAALRSPGPVPCPDAPTVEGSTAEMNEDSLLCVSDLVHEGFAPNRRVPKSARTVRNWIRGGKVPRPIQGFGLESQWRRSQFTKAS